MYTSFHLQSAFNIVSSVQVPQGQVVRSIDSLDNEALFETYSAMYGHNHKTHAIPLLPIHSIT